MNSNIENDSINKKNEIIIDLIKKDNEKLIRELEYNFNNENFYITAFKNNNYPFSIVISKNNIKMTKLILEYIIKTNKSENLIKEEDVLNFSKIISQIDIPLRNYENLIKIKMNKKYITYKRYINLSKTKPKIKRKNKNKINKNQKKK